MKTKEIKYKEYKTRGCSDCKKRIERDKTYCAMCWLKRAFDSGLKLTITS